MIKVKCPSFVASTRLALSPHLHPQNSNNNIQYNIIKICPINSMLIKTAEESYMPDNTFHTYSNGHIAIFSNVHLFMWASSIYPWGAVASAYLLCYMTRYKCWHTTRTLGNVTFSWPTPIFNPQHHMLKNENTDSIFFTQTWNTVGWNI